MDKATQTLQKIEAYREKSAYIVAALGFCISDEVSKKIAHVIAWLHQSSGAAQSHQDEINAVVQTGFLILIGLFTAIQLICGWRKNKLKEKSHENRWLEYKEMMQGHLLQIAKGKLEFADNGKDRINIYVYDGESYFVRAGRFSYNPRYCTGGRQVYPEDEGCINRAWENGTYAVSLPDPRKDLEQYIKAHHDMSLSKDTASQLRMKPRFYYGIRFSRDSDSHPLGVIVIESDMPNRFSEVKLSERLREDCLYISNITQRYIQDVPKLSIATKKGF